MAQPTLDKFGVPVIGDRTGRGILMPKIKWRFRVSFTNFGTLAPNSIVSRQVVSAGRPTLTSSRTAIHSYSNVVWYGAKPEWSTIEIVLRDDVSNALTTSVSAQLQKQMNHFDQTTFLAGQNYKFNATIETLTGDGQTLEEWFLEGCYLETVAYDQFEYSSSEPMQITLTVSFDNATQATEQEPELASNQPDEFAPGSPFI